MEWQVSSVSLPQHSGVLRVPPRQQRNRIARYCNVIYALMMHDIKNRFFGSGLGQILMVIWPFAHVIVLLVIYTFTHRPNPYGDSLVQYITISIFPFICFNYVSRWILFSATQNRSFLQYPIIRPLDIVIARVVLEVVSITLVAFLLITMLLVMGENPLPQDPIQAVCAFGASLFLAIGMGVLNAAIAFVVPMWQLVYIIVIIGSYISSGIMFVAADLPEQIRTVLSYNPLLICVEWMRTAYYWDYPTLMVDKTYCLEFSLITLTLGLILIRVLRRLIS